MDYLVDSCGIISIKEYDMIKTKDSGPSFSKFLEENYKTIDAFDRDFDREILRKRLTNHYSYDTEFVKYIESVKNEDIQEFCKIINKFNVIRMIENDSKFRGSTFMEILRNYEEDNNIKIADVEINK